MKPMRRAFLATTLAIGCFAAAFPAGELRAQEANSSSSSIAQINVDASQTGAPISKYIYGQFIEHLGRCIYGGIWAEMLEDRKFYFDVPATNDIWRLTREQARVLAASPWKVIGPAETVSMDEKDIFVGKHSPQIKASGGSTVGIYQEELGVLKGKEYTGYILLAGEGQVAPVTVSLSWGTGRKRQGGSHDQTCRQQIHQGAV